MELIYGMDVSGYQSQIDWKLALSLGRRFSISKISDGIRSTADKMHANHQAGARAAGLADGDYHFFRFDPSPTDQAELFLKLSGGVQDGQLPPCCDVEWDNNSSNRLYRDSQHGGVGCHIDNAGAEKALKFLQYIEPRVGITPMIYTSAGFFYGITDESLLLEFARYPLWIAAYTKSFDQVHIPKPWTKATFWQYSGSEHIAGVQQIDGDAFLGTIDELKALTKGQSAVTPAPAPSLNLNGTNVQAIQHAINQAGYSPALTEDGIRGPMTKAALLAIANT